MATYLTAFNNLIFKFTDDLIETFPEENDFKVYKRALTILKSANAKKMCVIFKSYSQIYREKILNKDETFFLVNDYAEIKEANDDENTVEQVINKLKKYWGELSEDNKQKIWKYLETLIKLSDLIM
tara:strand:- start:47 stop:424 length:378 start_codon:yes stop_codon:yes gene_type:complete